MKKLIIGFLTLVSIFAFAEISHVDVNLSADGFTCDRAAIVAAANCKNFDSGHVNDATSGTNFQIAVIDQAPNSYYLSSPDSRFCTVVIRCQYDISRQISE